MSFTAKITGQDKIQKTLEKYASASSAEMRQALTLAAFKVQATAKRSIQNSPADPQTKRSRPGNPPKTDTGRLVNSIFVNVIDGPHGVIAEVGSNVHYAKLLEFGTKEIAARPWLGPAMQANRNGIIKLIADALKKVKKR